MTLILRLLIFCYGSGFLLPSPVFAAPRYGLWIEAEGKEKSYDNPENIKRLLEFIDKNKFTDLYCQVYRRGLSWFPSVHADDSPYREALSQGVDPLKEIIAHAKTRGIKVHLWLNALRVQNNPSAPLFSLLGPEVALVDDKGVSLLDYLNEEHASDRSFSLDTPGVWLDPANPKLRRYLQAVIEDAVRAYPEIDGIHLDMLRAPFAVGAGHSTRFGYNLDSVERFHLAQGLDLASQFKRYPNTESWREWRRSQTTLVVIEIAELIKRLNPKLELSAAVIAWPDRAENHALQPWRSWLNAQIIDLAVLMAYTQDTTAIQRMLKQNVKRGSESSIQVGLGGWLMLADEERLLDQVTSSIALGADGVVLFSYANLISPRGQNVTERISKLIQQTKLSR